MRTENSVNSDSNQKAQWKLITEYKMHIEIVLNISSKYTDMKLISRICKCYFAEWELTVLDEKV